MISPHTTPLRGAVQLLEVENVRFYVAGTKTKCPTTGGICLKDVSVHESCLSIGGVHLQRFECNFSFPVDKKC